MLNRKFLDSLIALADAWEERERNSPYGLDDHGNSISALDGNLCAQQLKQLVSRINLNSDLDEI